MKVLSEALPLAILPCHPAYLNNTEAFKIVI